MTTALMQELNARALELGVPFSAHLDVTYRCNERCVHCYLDHDDHGEMTLLELKSLLDQLAEAGVFFLTLSGGEVLMRMDHRPEIHDGITKLPGSLKRSVAAIRLLKSRGVNVTMANVLMRQNLHDYAGVRALAKELCVEVTTDPTITPKMDGDRGVLGLGIRDSQLNEIFHDSQFVGNVDEFCARPAGLDDAALDGLPCSAGHTYCYISPYGDVYPCVQFPLACGNVRKEKFLDIWRHSKRINEVRSIRARDLPTCSTCAHLGSCTRCPGLAFMEGNMRGPSSLDCEKSLARTGIPSANMIARMASRTGMHDPAAHPSSFSSLIQITTARS